MERQKQISYEEEFDMPVDQMLSLWTDNVEELTGRIENPEFLRDIVDIVSTCNRRFRIAKDRDVSDLMGMVWIDLRSRALVKAIQMRLSGERAIKVSLQNSSVPQGSRESVRFEFSVSKNPYITEVSLKSLKKVVDGDQLLAMIQSINDRPTLST